MSIIIHRCHDAEDKGAQTAEGLTEWHISDDVNRAIRDYLIERGKPAMRFGGSLSERIKAANFANRTEGVPCTVEVHCNGWIPEEPGYFCMAWYKSRLAKLLGQCILSELRKLRPEAPNRGLCLCSEHRRWIGSEREYKPAPRLALLQDTTMAAVIIEACHLHVPEEATWISNIESRHALGRSVAKGIIKYLKRR